MVYDPPNPFSRVKSIMRCDLSPPMLYLIDMDNTSKCISKPISPEDATYLPWSWIPNATYGGQRQVGSYLGDLWFVDTADGIHRELVVSNTNANLPLYDGYTNHTTGNVLESV